MKKLLKYLLAIFLTSISLSVYATPFSPYSDITLNVHWDSTYEDLEPIDLSEISKKSGVKNFTLAFITDSGNCVPAWGGQSAYAVEQAWAKHMIDDKLRANGIGYVISFGGASGNDISGACSDEALVKNYEKVISMYQPSGLDFDIENGTANVPKIMHALKQIQKQFPKLKISFTLPVMPEGLTGAGESIVKEAAAAGLNFHVNIMAMDYGPGYVNDMGEYAVQAATNLFHFLKTLFPEKLDADIWQMIEVTPMIGVNDVNVEQFTLANVDTLREFAKRNQLGGLAMWEIGRDKPCADKWTNPNCSGNNLQKEAYEFSRRFQQ